VLAIEVYIFSHRRLSSSPRRAPVQAAR
jgi:hypothetical protein